MSYPCNPGSQIRVNWSSIKPEHLNQKSSSFTEHNIHFEVTTINKIKEGN